MAEYISGPVAVWTWVYSGNSGTITLSTDYRNASFQPSVNYSDASAGSDTHIVRLTALKDSKASMTLVNQTGNAATTRAALAAGVSGTLTMGPEGTVAGKPKIIMPAFCDGANYDNPYSDVATISVGFTGTGSYTETTF